MRNLNLEKLLAIILSVLLIFANVFYCQVTKVNAKIIENESMAVSEYMIKDSAAEKEHILSKSKQINEVANKMKSNLSDNAIREGSLENDTILVSDIQKSINQTVQPKASTISDVANNLIYNGDFNADPTIYGTWNPLYNNEKSVPSYLWDETVFHGSYGHSIKISGNDIDAYLYNEVIIDPNAKFSFSFYGKGENITDSSEVLGSYVYIQQMDVNGELISDTQDLTYKAGTFDWSKGEFSFVTAPNAYKVLIMLSLEGSGTVWYDDVALVREIPVTGVTLNKTGNNLKIGQTEQLIATLYPYYATDTNIIWSVIYQSKEKVASVSPTGLVTALNLGSATIRASSRSNPEKYADYLLTVASLPNITLPADAEICDTLMHPSLPVLYMTDSKNKKLYSVDYNTGVIRSIAFEYPVERMAIHGNELYVNEVISGHYYYTTSPCVGKIAIINMQSFSVVDYIDTDIDPYDVETDNKGNIYVISGSNQHDLMKSYDRVTKKELSNTYCYMQGLIEMNPLGNKLYSIDQSLSPIKFHSNQVIDGKFVGKQYDSPYHGDYNINSIFKISPDGKYIFNGRREVFYCSEITSQSTIGIRDNRNLDLAHAFTLSGVNFNTLDFDLGSNLFYTGSDSGIISYSYTDFKVKNFASTSGRVKWLFNTQNSIIAVIEYKSNYNNDGPYSYYIEKIDKVSFGRLPEKFLDEDSYARMPRYNEQNAVKAELIEIGKTKTNAYNSLWFKFMPSISGTYRISRPPYRDMALFDSNGFEIAFINYGLDDIKVNLDANEYYFLGVTGEYNTNNYDLSIKMDMQISSVSLNKQELSIESGKNEQLFATVLPNEVANKNVIWSVLYQSTNDVVALSTTGVVTAHRPGTAVVRAISQVDASKYAECVVTVKPILGDVNGDNLVNLEDTKIIKNNLLGTVTTDNLAVSDLDCDGKITSRDYALLLKIVRSAH